MMNTDHTHDSAALSWVESANEDGCDFPVQNLPYGRFRRAGSDEPWRIGVAIGDQILDIRQLVIPAQAGIQAAGERALESRLRGDDGHCASGLVVLAQGDLNAFMALPPAERIATRHAIFMVLKNGSPPLPTLPQAEAEMAVPCRIGDYTDFYTGIHHATTVGKLFRPDQPLMPNYKWVPIGYHGRASSIVISGTPVRRPSGQLKPPHLDEPNFEPSKRLDYELELGVFVAGGNALGEPIALAQADDHLFGVCLLNDWSARDMQGWEYQPLGPFLAKSFATTVSPWIVTMEALAPFRCAALERPEGDPQPLPYLDSTDNRQRGGFAIELAVWLQTAQMRAHGEPATRLMRSNFSEAAYWTLAQMLTHHASNGCNLRPGDLMGTGTLSGPQAEEGGSMLELSLGGKQQITLANGEQRSFLLDGDALTLRGRAVAAGARSIGFGDCAGVVSAAS